MENLLHNLPTDWKNKIFSTLHGTPMSCLQNIEARAYTALMSSCVDYKQAAVSKVHAAEKSPSENMSWLTKSLFI